MKSEYYENDSMDLDLLIRGFQAAILILLIQNILLFVSGIGGFFIDKRIDSDSPTIPFGIAFSASLYLDIIAFALLAIFSLSLMLRSQEPSSMALLVIGSALFIIGSLAWRPIMGFMPENPISSTLGTILLSDIRPNTDSFIDFSTFKKVVRALLISNSGLLLVSIGLSMIIPTDRKDLKKYAIIYGAVNILLTLTIFLIFVKIFIATLIILPVLRYMVSNEFLVSLELT